MLVSEWLSWMLMEEGKKKDGSGRSLSCRLPSVSFSKRSRSFSLYFYLSKDSYISKFDFFYDGGEVLPVIAVSDKGFSDEGWSADGRGGSDASRLADEEMCKSLALFLISNFFSFNLTSLKKAIHHKGKLYLSPKIASINSHFFGIKVSRHSRQSDRLVESSHMLQGHELLVFIRRDGELMRFITSAALSFDLSSFDDFFIVLKKKASLGGFAVRKEASFSAFRNLVLDFQ